MKIFLAIILIAAINTLKPSQVGVNDWHLHNIGEIHSLNFLKNKVQFISQLGQIGTLDKFTGKIQSRFVISQTEKVVGIQNNELTIGTRHNQLITYSFTPIGIDKSTNDQFLGSAKKIDSYTKKGLNKYYMTASSLSLHKDIIRQAKDNEQFLRISIGQKINQGQILFLALKINNEVCIQSYHEKEFKQSYCFESPTKEISQMVFSYGRLAVSTKQFTIILSQDLQVVSRIQQQLIEVIKNIAIFPTHSYLIEQNQKIDSRPVLSSKEDIIITLHESSNQILFFKDGIDVFSVPHNSTKSQVRRAWFNHKSELDFDLVIQYSDLQLNCYSVSRGSVEENWRREQSLAYTKDAIFLKYNQQDTLDNPYHRTLISHTYRAKSFTEKILMIPMELTLRLKEEVTELTHYFSFILGHIIQNIGSIDRSSIQKFKMSKQQQIKYGLRKYLIIATEYNNYIALDSKTKQILWKTYHNQGQLIGLFQLKRDYQTQNAILVSYSEDSQLIFIEEILSNGEIVLLSTLSSNKKPVVYKLNDHSILIKMGVRVEKFKLFEHDDLVEKEYYFYTTTDKQIEGWKVIGNSVSKIWNFNVKGNEKIMKVASAFRGDQRSYIPLFDKEKVFFKNVDFTNIAVLSSTNNTNIGLYIVNGRTGKVQFNSYKTNINNGLPVNLVYDQNNVLVSYYHSKNKMFEIWTVEQYQQKMQTSAINMISNYLKGSSYQPQQNREQSIFETQVYGSPVAIKQMYVSESKMSLTRRNIFIITRQSKLYMINRDFVNTRRPKSNEKEKGFFSNEKLPEYNYILPFNPTFYLSYDVPLANIKSIIFSPTDMQSSIFTFCYGLDIFLIRTAPDKTFDMITEDFNYVMLLLILVGGTVVIVFFKRQVNLAKLKKPHLE